MKIAAVWCRVSTDGQRELSLDSQEAAVKMALQAQGYEVPPEHVVKVAWTSLDLMSCPEFLQLRRWIADGVVQAVGTFDRDRLQAQGLQRLMFFAECNEKGVEIINAQGAPMLEGGEGQLIELALALGKERSVLRAQQGARDGLRDRARLKGLPPSPVNFLGYRWHAERRRYGPDERYTDACEIWRMALAKMSINGIATELTRRGIPTPAGNKRRWQPWSVRHILRNRSYAGVVEALKTEAVEPKRRVGNTYGKTAKRSRPRDERIRLEGLIERPIVSEKEFEWMQKRLHENQQFAAKNTRLRTYLLSGMITCAECGRAYVGTSRRSGERMYSYYVCGRHWKPGPSGDRCDSRSLNAGVTEDAAFRMVSEFLKGGEGFGAEMRRRQGGSQESEASLRRELVHLDIQDRKEKDAEAKAYNLAAHSDVSEDAFNEVIGLIRTKRQWIAEQRARLLNQVEELERHRFNPEAVELLHKRLSARLEVANPEDRRFVLEAVGAKVVVRADGRWDLELQVPRQDPELPILDLQTVNSRPNGAGA